jgi:hypothetical protein
MTRIGDAELGDVDGDGDLDIVITDWGAQDPGTTGSGRTDATVPQRRQRPLHRRPLLLNDGHGVFTLAPGAATPDDTPGTLGIAVADVDGDGRVDVVQSQGEVAFPEKIQLATAMIAVDTHAPVIQIERMPGRSGIVHARVHDRISPLRLVDFPSVALRANGQAVPMRWYGEYLWAAQLPAQATAYEVCATDRRGNSACVSGGDDPGDDPGKTSGDAGVTHCPDSRGCPRAGCCDVGGDSRGACSLALVIGVCLRADSRSQRDRRMPAILL